jgi:hypothetical protein
MPLYVPRLSPKAVPPLNYPPPAKPWRLVLHILSAVSCGAFSSRCAVFLSAGLTFTRPVVIHALFMIIGYFYVSSLVLRRPHWMHSRYGNSQELIKLLGLGIPCLLIGGSALDSACSTLSSAVWTWLWFVLALNYSLLDNNAGLQRFGVLFSRLVESVQCPIPLVLVVLGTVLGLAWCLLQLHECSSLLILRIMLLASLISLPAIVYRTSHALHIHHYLVAAAVVPLCTGSDAW